MKEFLLALESPEATAHAGAALGRVLRKGDVVALWGDLGTGKTALTRALIQSLNPAEAEVPSPTFTLVQEYQGPECPILHFDLYRLASPEDVYELGWEDVGEIICLIEWPDRLESLLPANRFDITLHYGAGEQARLLTVRGPEHRTNDLENAFGEQSAWRKTESPDS